eukprot:GHVR01093829.1.p1 GENE.GHVR01093829.1~~GHVR01093829.1.p1  ORF type:complete len:193 (-),score=42.97 GHVR01093829.1:124-702(-)
MYRMAVSCFILPTHVDRYKCMRLALVHDIAESITGDITPFCNVSKEDKYYRELEAMKTITQSCPAAIGEEILNLWMEYGKGETEESKYVCDLDLYEMMLQAVQYENVRKIIFELLCCVCVCVCVCLCVCITTDQGIELNSFFEKGNKTFQTPFFIEFEEKLRSERRDRVRGKTTPSQHPKPSLDKTEETTNT